MDSERTTMTYEEIFKENFAPIINRENQANFKVCG